MKRQLSCIILPTLLSHASLACFSHQQYARSEDLSNGAWDPLVRRTRCVESQDKIEIVNARVFNGESFTDPGSVFIDGRIIAGPFSPNATFATVDAGGRFLIPGLIDAHVHVPDAAGLEDLTRHGVTTGLNMACSINYTYCRALRKFPETPDGAGLASLFTAGHGATTPGSHHAQMFNLPPDRLIYENSDPAAYIGYAFGNGSDYYKITAETNGPSQRLQNALVSEAHKLGQMAFTHASDTAAIHQAIESRTDAIQHISADRLLTDDMVARVKANGQWITPTMNIFRLALADPMLIHILRGNATTNETYAVVRENVALLHKAGVPILAGTDAVGTFQVPTGDVEIPFGSTLHAELENLVEAGLTEAEAIRAATSLVAEKHQLGDRGAVEIGKRADIVLLDANPMENITNIRKVYRTWVAGVELDG